jgi:aminopeptidase YwaD
VPLLFILDVRPNAANSDHYWFTQKGIPAVFIYSMGDVTAYHDVDDKAEDLKYTHFDRICRFLILAINGQ